MDYLSRMGLFFGQILCVTFFLLTLSSCITSLSSEQCKPVVRHDDNQVHVVQWSDETLSAITSWYTGSTDNLDALANANSTVDLTRMQQGEQIFIPQSLLKTKKAMPRNFLDTFLSTSVMETKIRSGPPPEIKVRILTPVPYKKKKDGKSLPVQEVHSVQKERVSSPEEDVGWHLFGPR